MKSPVLVSLLRACRSLVSLFDLSGDRPVKRYHPEDHYMRGPGPKWRKKHRRSKGPLETVIVDPAQIVLQERGGAFVRLHDRRAKLRAGAAEKFEIRAAILPRMEPVDFTGDPVHGQPVGIVQRHGIAQDRQMPGAQRAGKPLHLMNVGVHPCSA